MALSLDRAFPCRVRWRLGNARLFQQGPAIAERNHRLGVTSAHRLEDCVRRTLCRSSPEGAAIPQDRKSPWYQETHHTARSARYCAQRSTHRAGPCDRRTRPLSVPAIEQNATAVHAMATAAALGLRADRLGAACVQAQLHRRLVRQRCSRTLQEKAAFPSSCELAPFDGLQHTV